MKKILQIYSNSWKELFVTKNVVLCGLMAALGVSVRAGGRLPVRWHVGYSEVYFKAVRALFLWVHI